MTKKKKNEMMKIPLIVACVRKEENRLTCSDYSKPLKPAYFSGYFSMAASLER